MRLTLNTVVPHAGTVELHGGYARDACRIRQYHMRDTSCLITHAAVPHAVYTRASCRDALASCMIRLCLMQDAPILNASNLSFHFRKIMTIPTNQTRFREKSLHNLSFGVLCFGRKCDIGCVKRHSHHVIYAQQIQQLHKTISSDKLRCRKTVAVSIDSSRHCHVSTTPGVIQTVMGLYNK